MTLVTNPPKTNMMALPVQTTKKTSVVGDAKRLRAWFSGAGVGRSLLICFLLLQLSIFQLCELIQKCETVSLGDADGRRIPVYRSENETGPRDHESNHYDLDPPDPKPHDERRCRRRPGDSFQLRKECELRLTPRNINSTNRVKYFVASELYKGSSAVSYKCVQRVRQSRRKVTQPDAPSDNFICQHVDTEMVPVTDKCQTGTRHDDSRDIDSLCVMCFILLKHVFTICAFQTGRHIESGVAHYQVNRDGRHRYASIDKRPETLDSRDFSGKSTFLSRQTDKDQLGGVDANMLFLCTKGILSRLVKYHGYMINARYILIVRYTCQWRTTNKDEHGRSCPKYAMDERMVEIISISICTYVTFMKIIHVSKQPKEQNRMVTSMARRIVPLSTEVLSQNMIIDSCTVPLVSYITVDNVLINAGYWCKRHKTGCIELYDDVTVIGPGLVVMACVFIDQAIIRNVYHYLSAVMGVLKYIVDSSTTCFSMPCRNHSRGMLVMRERSDEIVCQSDEYKGNHGPRREEHAHQLFQLKIYIGSNVTEVLCYDKMLHDKGLRAIERSPQFYLSNLDLKYVEWSKRASKKILIKNFEKCAGRSSHEAEWHFVENYKYLKYTCIESLLLKL